MQNEKCIKDVKSLRNYGLDILRVLSMLMVVVLHVNGKGGVYKSAEPMSAAYMAAWLIEMLAFVGVNCFGLISGYVGIEAKHKLSKIIVLWLQVFFYAFLITLLFEMLNLEDITYQLWLNALAPVSRKQYWYFTAYFPLFFFAPYLNRMINALTKRELVWLGGSIFFWCTWQTVIKEDFLQTGWGYSFLWLVVLYLMGGILKKLQGLINVKKSVLICGYFVGTIFTWGWKMVIEGLSIERVASDLFFQYISPTILLASIALTLFFSQIQIGKEWLKKAVSLGASSVNHTFIS